MDTLTLRNVLISVDESSVGPKILSRHVSVSLNRLSARRPLRKPLPGLSKTCELHLLLGALGRPIGRAL